MKRNDDRHAEYYDYRRENSSSAAVTESVEVSVEATLVDSKQVSVSSARKVINTLRQFATVSELLRILGAAIMVGSLSLFMMQGWLEGNDIQRYLKLLAQTVLLTAGGFGLSALLKEHKGARLFFGLGLASVAANFTILGALVYSIIQFDGMLGSYPEYAAWVSQSPMHVGLVTALALAILIPVTRLAFTVLARPAAKWLTTTYLVGGALLLLPVRSSVWSALLAVALVGFIIWNISRNRGDDRSPGTTESKFSIMMLLLPPVILCVRSFYFYSVEALALGCMAAAAFLLIRHCSISSESSTTQKLLDWLSLPLPLVTAFFLTLGLEVAHGELFFLTLAFLMMPMFGELTLRRPNTFRSVAFGGIGSLAICGALLVNQFNYQGLGLGLISMLGGLLMIATGYWLNRREISVLGMFTTSVIAAVNASHFFQWFNINNWVMLSVLGASAIILASLLDRYGAAFKLRLDEMRARRLSA